MARVDMKMQLNIFSLKMEWLNISEKAGLWQFRLHLITLVLLVLASVWPQWFFYPAALLFAVEQAFLLINLLKAAHLYKTKSAELLGVIQNPVEPV